MKNGTILTILAIALLITILTTTFIYSTPIMYFGAGVLTGLTLTSFIIWMGENNK